jgi:hypothetical protein
VDGDAGLVRCFKQDMMEIGSLDSQVAISSLFLCSARETLLAQDGASHGVYDSVLLYRAAVSHLLIHAKPIEESQAVAEDANGATKGSWLRTEFIDGACNIGFLLQSQGSYQTGGSAANDDCLEILVSGTTETGLQCVGLPTLLALDIVLDEFQCL